MAKANFESGLCSPPKSLNGIHNLAGVANIGQDNFPTNIWEPPEKESMRVFGHYIFLDATHGAIQINPESCDLVWKPRQHMEGQWNSEDMVDDEEVDEVELRENPSSTWRKSST